MKPTRYPAAATATGLCLDPESACYDHVQGTKPPPKLSFFDKIRLLDETMDCVNIVLPSWRNAMS